MITYKKIFYFSVSLILLFASCVVSAQNPVVDFDPPASRDYYPKIANPQWATGGAGETVAGIIAYGIGIAAILWVIAVTWAGIQMFLSVGEEAKFAKAKEMLIYSLIGVGISGLAYLIVTVVSRLNFS